jgi:hypothetical protein
LPPLDRRRGFRRPCRNSRIHFLATSRPQFLRCKSRPKCVPQRQTTALGAQKSTENLLFRHRKDEKNERRRRKLRPSLVFPQPARLENLQRWRWSAEACPVPKGADNLGHSGAFRYGHHAICSLLNAFPPEVQYSGAAYEGAAWAHKTLGVRPPLYYILRQEYLRRGGVLLCANVLCNRFFTVERGGQTFCTEECSRKQRQREYWASHGAALRRKRQAKERAKSRSRRNG